MRHARNLNRGDLAPDVEVHHLPFAAIARGSHQLVVTGREEEVVEVFREHAAARIEAAG